MTTAATAEGEGGPRFSTDTAADRKVTLVTRKESKLFGLNDTRKSVVPLDA